MQRNLGGCVSATSRSQVQSTANRLILRISLAGWRQLGTLMILCLLLGCGVAHAQGVNSASLAGTVLDSSGAAIRGAKVTVTNGATGSEWNAISDDAGRYNLLGLPPGQYKVSVDGGANFEVYKIDSFVLTVGDSVTRDFKLVLHGQQQSVEVIAEAANVETTKTEVSQTVQQREITNYPINGRSYINFTLTNSQTTRDVSPTIGPAPNSGLSVGGARARGTMVSVDGADAVDNSINAIRSTLSQEGIQEFQLILSNYNAEYGRASGGVINIVSKSGTNEFHGNAFGYFRNKAFQARNAFSGQVDPVTGTSIGVNKFGMQTVTLPTPAGPLPVQLTGPQAAAVNSLLSSGVPALQKLAVQYGVFMGSASSVALNGIDFGAVANGFYQSKGIPLTATPGAQFPIPVACPAGQPVNNGATCSNFGVYVAPLPASFAPLNGVRGNYPVMEKTSLWSARIDQIWSNRNKSFLRVGVSPSLVTGLPSTSQNQVFGQNSGTRAGLNQSRDLSFTFQHETTVSGTALLHGGSHREAVRIHRQRDPRARPSHFQGGRRLQSHSIALREGADF